ncbi:S24 family peptidase (plasmid) [Sphingobium sp. V4]|uniref:S24 family peptidase n=1 Tax=Sphingobium sp. V4 TaxID=3038927 RepID=UPI0025580703|nr:S24 family peptidase [Sphingobium sp. V4]WIW90461.1 S24 family peptidase [Sphingobium sp. V4]
MATDVANILDRLIAERGDTYARVSGLLGRNSAYVQQFIKRGTPRRLAEEDRRILAHYFGVPEETLGGRREISPRATGADIKVATASVARLSLGASAGHGTLDEDRRPADRVTFDARWLDQLGIDARNATIIRVDGESMMPTLNHGDDIMVDHADGAGRLRDGIYVLRLDGALMVKRIALGPRRGRFSVRSDNPLYPDWSELDSDLIHIVGRVVWAARRL